MEPIESPSRRALAFHWTDASHSAPWIDPDAARDDGLSVDAARSLADTRRGELAPWRIDDAALANSRARVDLHVITPGDAAGEPLHMLSALERRSPLWDTSPDDACAAPSSAVSLVLRVLSRDPDPACSREHVLLSMLAERRLANSDVGGGAGMKSAQLAGTLKRLGPQWFVVRDVHAGEGAVLLHPRWAISWLRGPLTRRELQRALGAAAQERERGSEVCGGS